MRVIRTFNGVWAGVITVGVGSYLLYRRLGWPLVAPLVFVLASVIIMTLIGPMIERGQMTLIRSKRRAEAAKWVRI